MTEPAHAGRRAALAALLGVPLLVVSIVLVSQAAVEGFGPPGMVGVAALVAGASLVALAWRLAVRGRHWALQAATALVALAVLGEWVVLPALTAGLATSAARPAPPPAASLALARAREVRIPAPDGVELAGWHVPGRNGAAVVLLHGSHGTRRSTAAHLRLLADAGFGALAIDARGHGASGGEPNALGWGGDGDVAAAARWLAREEGIEPASVGALGLSMGAEQALRAAGTGAPLAAVVAEGAGAATLGDQRLIEHGVSGALAASITWLGLREAELAGGVQEPPALVDVVARIGVPTLLVSSRAGGEETLAARFAERIGPRAERWHVSSAGHTRALASEPEAYRARVLAFLRRTLGATGR